ncbi:MAG: benzoate-CoA ligase family protein [Terriglobales bacterium]
MIALPTAFNAATYFVDRNVHEGRGAKIALECGEERVSYGQLLERTNQAGNVLRQFDMRPGERVLLMLSDGPEFLYGFFGAIKAGAVAVPLNPQLKPAEYEYVLNDTEARVAVVSDLALSQLRLIPQGHLKYLQEVVVVDQSQHHVFHRLMASASPDLEAQPTGRDDAAFWLYSSGSTGPPKGCIHRHRDMVVCSELYAKGILEMNESDRCYSVARLFFAYGLGNAGYFPLSCGATAILSPARPTPAGVFADIERYRPTLFFSVPSNYAALLAHRREQAGEFDLSSVRYAVSAGEALPAPLFERFKQRFGVEILDAWGSTETLQMVLANRPGEVRPGSSGKVIPGYEAKLVDERGQEVARGEIGTMLIKGDSTCAGYWNQHEKTAATFQGNWFRTGDKYQQDEEGYFWYAGRADDMFKVNGRWLSPTEVESALIAHPAVREAAVVAREDEHGLTKPAACVVVNADVRADDELASTLQDWVAQRVGTYKRPRWVSFLSELPKTATGKVQRYKLRALQAEQAGNTAPAGHLEAET